MSKQQITFDAETWRRGTRGFLKGNDDLRRAYIENMRIHQDGHLYVRPAWFRWGYHATGGFQVLSGFDREKESVFWVAQYRNDTHAATSGPALMLFDGGGIKSFNYDIVGDPPTTYWTSTDHNARPVFGAGDIQPIDQYNFFVHGRLIRNEGNSGSNGTIVDGGTPLVGRFITAGQNWDYVASIIHQGRSFWTGVTSVTSDDTNIRGNRIYYSDPVEESDYSGYVTFSSNTQYFDVDGEVRGMMSIGANLLFWTQEGHWYILTGRGDPSKGLLHHRGRNQRPATDDNGARFQDYGLFVDHAFSAVCIVNADGVIDSTTLDHLGRPLWLAGEFRRSPICANPRHATITVPQFNLGTAANMTRGVWTNEDWSEISTPFDDRMQIRSFDNLRREYLGIPVDAGGGNWDWEVYWRFVDYKRPSPYVDATGTQPAGTVVGKIFTPRIDDPDLDIAVRQVTIDGRYFKNSSGSVFDDVAMTVSIQDSESTTNHTCTLDTNLSTLAADLDADGLGQPFRIVAVPNGALPYRSWSEVHLTGLQAVGVERIMVETELSGRRIH